MRLDKDDPVTRAGHMARYVRRKFFAVLFLYGFLPAAGVAAFFGGGAILVYRLLTGEFHGDLFAGIAGFALLSAMLSGIVFAWRKLPDSRRLLIWLDGASHCGGLLTTSLEIDPGEWRRSIAPVVKPRIKFSSGRGWVMLPVGLLFFAGAFLLPESAISKPERHTLDLTRETAELEQKIEILEEEALMPEKELADLNDGVEELKAKNDATNPARMFEMHEALSRRVGLAGEEAASRIREESRTMQMLSSALDTLGALPAEQFTPEAAAQMGELLRKLAEDNPELAELLKQGAASAMSLDPESMKRLAEAMRDSSGKLEQQLARMIEAKLAQAQCAKPGSQPGGSDGERGGSPEEAAADLAEWLAQNAPGADELEAAMMMGYGIGMIPGFGSGEPGRGRGDAPLLFSGNTPGFGGKEVDLALAGEMDPARSMSVQQFASAPDSADEERAAAAAGHLRGGDARIDRNENRIYPAHRGAVERYFNPKGERNSL